MQKRMISILLCLMMVLQLAAIVPAMAEGEPLTSGDCVWELDEQTLTVSGEGEMADYSDSNPAPWGTDIVKLVIEDGVTYIGERAFYGCNALTEVVFGKGVDCIGREAFAQCGALTELALPDTVTAVKGYAFNGCESLTTLNIPSGITNIDDAAFYGCEAIEKFEIPAGVETIGRYSFGYCGKLTELEIADTVKSIGINAFRGCSSLVELHLPKSIETVERCAFGGCKSIEVITVEPGNPNFIVKGNCLIETATKTLVAGCKNSVIPDDGSVTAIGDSAFYKCSLLAAFDIPDCIKSIGDSAFLHCPLPKTLMIPGAVTAIGAEAFAECAGLTSVVIGNGVTEIGNCAFKDCDDIQKVEIGKSLKTFGEDIFYGASIANMKYHPECKVWIPISMGGVKVLSLPGMQTIPEEMFRSCKNLTTLTVAEGTKIIGNGAFIYCAGLSELYLPKSLSTVDYDAFYYTSVKNVYYAGSEKQWKSLLIRGLNDGNVVLARANIKYDCGNTDVTTIFTDVKKTDWFYKNGSLNYAYNAGLFGGTSATTFAPNAKMTRGMFVAVLGRLAGVTQKNAATKFKDVKKSAYYSGYVKWANDKNIVGGTSTTTFEPDASITREQICKMMVEYCRVMGVTLSTATKEVRFNDRNRIAPWAREYVKTCQMAGLVNGKDNNMFDPAGSATRAEVATILYNFDKKY